MTDHTFYERMLLDIMNGLIGSLEISSETLADIARQNGREIFIEKIAKAAGCEVFTKNSVGVDPEPAYIIMKKA